MAAGAVAAGVVAALLGAGVVALLCAAAVALLAFVDTDSGYVPIHSFGLPGVPDGAPRVVSVHATIHFGSVAAGAVVLVGLAAWDAPAWASVLVAVSVAVIAGLRAAPWILGRRHARRVTRALIAYDPRVAIGYAGRSGGPWQLKMWEPFIVRSGERAVVINVHERYVSMILEGADLSSPLVQLGSWGLAELDDVLVPSLRVIFYVQNARENAAFLAHHRLTHVWLNHGDSDKPGSRNSRHAHYDLLVVAGQAAVDRYERHGVTIARDKFVVLGRPQTAGTAMSTGAVSPRADMTVLYAPTWQGVNERVNFSSLEQGPAIVRALIERGATVWFRPHPLSYRWRRRRAAISEIRQILKQDRDSSTRPHRWGTQIDSVWSIADLTNRCDALVSDVSGVVSDFLVSGKPYAMTSGPDPVDVFREKHPVAEAAYVILGDMSNLDEALDGLLLEDPLAGLRDERRRHVLGDVTGEESADAFAEFVHALAEGD